MATSAVEPGYSGRTAWARNLETPLRMFLRTETGSATVLVGAVVFALLWANVDLDSYVRLWEHTTLSISVGDHALSHDLRYWVNSGLMTLFFFVVGLEARREFDLGELRERSRAAIPLAAGIGGMIVPIAIFLAFNAGSSSRSGWGVAMSTDTAFALGLLSLVGRRVPFRLRAFLLTFSVVDDLAAIAVIATVYAAAIDMSALAFAFAIFVLMVAMPRLRIRRGASCLILGTAAWIALSKSGVDPIVIGLAMGLITYSAAPARDDLERATDLFRMFREQPTPELARTARAGLASTISPNERLQQVLHPWTSFVIVPLFAIANAGIALHGGFLGRAATSPITLGIIVGYVLGKPVGIVGASWLVTRLSRGRLRPPVGWGALVGGGAIAGIGFTVSLLIADTAFSGDQLDEAKAGVLGSVVFASLVSAGVFRLVRHLPLERRITAVLGGSEPIVDLAVPVDSERDHVRGPMEAPITLLEYGDFECPYCGRAEPVIRDLLADFGDLRYVWRHLPLNDVHPHTQLAAEASEAAADQGVFWPMYDLLITHQDALEEPDLVSYAEELGLDIERFEEDLRRHSMASRVAEDVDSADLSGVSGTPSFFINGRRYQGAYDIETLSAAVRVARARASIAA
ncbi:MAG TPA: Na+/H+ antiporter NhaA [Gaiellaceae bacterium]|nr:Na+/H+ antiporter NhaA [Gaiellaceae bacterium]